MDILKKEVQIGGYDFIITVKLDFKVRTNVISNREDKTHCIVLSKKDKPEWAKKFHNVKTTDLLSAIKLAEYTAWNETLRMKNPGSTEKLSGEVKMLKKLGFEHIIE